jgi:hypothetical protein
MQSKGIAWRYVLRQRRIPGDDLKRADETKPRGCERRHVQRLADMARGIRAICVLMEKRRASGEIEQHRAAKHRQRAADRRSAENGCRQTHQATIQRTTLDGSRTDSVAKD